MEIAAKSRLFLDRLRGRARDIEKSLERLLPAAETLPDEKTEFLPNFCTGEVVFNVVVVAEMLAIVINLIIPRNFLSPTVLQDLLLISLFIQWVALAGTAVLCYTRKHLNRLPNLRALVMAYLLLLLTTFLVSECAIWLLWALGRVQTARPAWYADFHILNLTISAIINGLLLRLFLAKHELTQRTLSEARAKLQALQSRIRPHFVFNSLNIISSLIRSAPEKAETAIEDMADLFRMMLSQDEMLVPVKNEIDRIDPAHAVRGARQVAGAAIAHPPAFRVQQPEHHRLAGSQRAEQGRDRDRGHGRPVSHDAVAGRDAGAGQE